jgi:sensor histidine kinase regulating citrate/malate metabolism
VDFASFERNFGKTFEEAFPSQVAFVLERGFMERTNGSGGGEGLFLTKSGVENFNGVIALFYAPSVQSHLIALQPPKT